MPSFTPRNDRNGKKCPKNSKICIFLRSIRNINSNTPAKYQSVTFRFRNFSKFFIVSVSVLKIFGIVKSIGIGFGKNLVSKKVSDSVSKKIGIGKKFRIRFRSDFGFRHTLLKCLKKECTNFIFSSASISRL